MKAKREETSRLPWGDLQSSHQDGGGHVHRCDAGCFHVSFGDVTLDFADEAGFFRLEQRLRAHRRGLAEVELRYGAALLRLSLHEFDRLVELVGGAATHWRLVTELYNRPAA